METVVGNPLATDEELMTIQELQEKAQALGVGEAALDAAEEKAELMALIAATQAAQPGTDDAGREAAEAAEAAQAKELAELRKELEGTKLRELQKRAVLMAPPRAPAVCSSSRIDAKFSSTSWARLSSPASTNWMRSTCPSPPPLLGRLHHICFPSGDWHDFPRLLSLRSRSRVASSASCLCA